jgi:hypothetical protein
MDHRFTRHDIYPDRGGVEVVTLNPEQEKAIDTGAGDAVDKTQLAA